MDDQTTLEWAQQAFGSTQLGNRSRTKRLVMSASRIAQHASKSLPQIFGWNDLRAFYGLCARKEMTLAVVQGPHWQQTRALFAQHKLVLVLHDTSTIDFTHHLALKDVGPVGDGNGRGFLQHNSLALVPEPRQVLGLAYQQLKVREPAPEKETTFQRRKRPRESDLWLEGIQACGEAPEGCCLVDVGDRGADIYEAMRRSRSLKHHFLFRVYQDRVIRAGAADGPEEHLLSHARRLPSMGQDIVEIPGRGGKAPRQPRTAVVQLAASEIWVPAPAGTSQRQSQPLIQAWLIRIWEEHPPAGVEGIEWLLLCSLPTQTLAELKERRDWYSCRWVVEIYHDVEKNGCSLQERRFESAKSMEACLAVLALVAVRVLSLRYALEHQPDAPAEQVATPLEIEVVRRSIKEPTKTASGQPRKPSAVFTVRDFVRNVAKLGGFLGRKSDGEPGVRALWRGYERLQDMLVGYATHHRLQTIDKNSGNR
jgi:Transposase DNA-binding/Transposase Tn5 dimerisation domain